MPVDRVTRRELRMAQDSDGLFVVNVVVWVLVVILAIVALHCPLSRRVVRCVPYDVINVLSASWD